jgi:hypothetical protein
MRIIFRQVREIVKNKLLLVVVFSVSSVLMFSESLAAETKNIGMNSTAFSMLIGLVIIFSFQYIYGYLLRLHMDKIAILNMLGIKKQQILAIFSSVLFISSVLISFCGVVAGSVVFRIVQRRFFFERLEKNIYIKAMIIFSIYLILALFINCIRVNKKSIKNLFEERIVGRVKILNYKLSIFVCLFSVIITGICINGLVIEEQIQQWAVSGGMMSLIVSIISFYFMFYETLFRVKDRNGLKRVSTLCICNILTKDIIRNIWISILLSLCLIFSFIAYISGNVFFADNIKFISSEFRMYFAVVQMCISIIMLMIYYIVLAMHMVIELNLFKADTKILFCVGYDKQEINSLLCGIIIWKLLIPAIASWGAIITISWRMIFQKESILAYSPVKTMIVFILLYTIFFLGYSMILYKEYKYERRY